MVFEHLLNSDISLLFYFEILLKNNAKKMKQPTAPLYPELPAADRQNYRLQKMQERHCIRSIKGELILQMKLILH